MLVFALLLAVFVGQSDSVIPDEIARYLATEDAVRANEARYLNDQIKTAGKKKQRKRVAELKQQLKDLPSRQILPTLNSYRKDEIGALDELAEVRQVLDADTLVIEHQFRPLAGKDGPEFAKKMRIVLKGVNTKGLADEDPVSYAKTVFVCDGPEDFSAVFGGKKTLHVLRAIDMDEVDKYREAWEKRKGKPAQKK